MRINRLIVDLLTGDVHETDLFSPMVCFKGGGSSSTTTVDYEYNWRMATIAEKQQQMADAYFDFWKTDYYPMEKAQIKANLALIPEQAKTEWEKNKAAQGILQKVQAENKYAQPVMAEYYKKALGGVNVDTRVAEARAGVRQAYGQQEGIAQRNMSRLGIDPTSGNALSAMAGRNLEEAKSIAGSSTLAKNTAEAENFARLTDANKMYKSNLGLGG